MSEEKIEETEDLHGETRRQVKKGLKTVEGLRELFKALGADPRPEIAALLSGLEDELEALRPPEPRKCKEFLRALGRAKKGLMGVSPEDVALYCKCAECTALRARQGLQQPAGPIEVEAPASEDVPSTSN
ncbi:MAG: hypothetical protein IT384_11355 [Deltaproteobacteria bacterium]|nr:hypothetical protein [Deltaproteobacteria bacterium]